MDRGEFLNIAAWRWWMIFIGVINPLFPIPQLYQIVTTGVTEGISIETFVLVVVIQATFSAQGYLRRDRVLFASNGIAALVSSSVVVAVLVY